MREFARTVEAVLGVLEEVKRRHPDPRVRLHPELSHDVFTAEERARVHRAWTEATAGDWDMIPAMGNAAEGSLPAGAQVLDWLGEVELAARARAWKSLPPTPTVSG